MSLLSSINPTDLVRTFLFDNFSDRYSVDRIGARVENHIRMMLHMGLLVVLNRRMHDLPAIRILTGIDSSVLP